jgi:hypothetical protein
MPCHHDAGALVGQEGDAVRSPGTVIGRKGSIEFSPAPTGLPFAVCGNRRQMRTRP